MLRVKVHVGRFLARSGWLLASLVYLVLALPSPGAAQSPAEGGVAASVDRSAAAARVDISPVIDGQLDEGAWQGTEILSDFVQYEPVEFAQATERTEVRFLLDAEALYVGARLLDRDAETGIIMGERRRDANLTDSDAFLIVLDTYLDEQTGFIFGTNPGGIEYDGQVRGERSANTSWDGAWTVASTQDAEGWYVEMRIPFSTIRYGPGDEQTWGLNMTRYIGRKNEQVVWSPVAQQYGFYRLTEAGRLRGVTPPPRRIASVTPYVLGAASRVPPVNPNTTYPLESGVDAKIGITQALTLDLTVNTDFAQVEVDDAQVDLTRFSLFFPEKRPFFLENADLFSIGAALPPGTHERAHRTLSQPPDRGGRGGAGADQLGEPSLGPGLRGGRRAPPHEYRRTSRPPGSGRVDGRQSCLGAPEPVPHRRDLYLACLYH